MARAMDEKIEMEDVPNLEGRSSLQVTCPPFTPWLSCSLLTPLIPGSPCPHGSCINIMALWGDREFVQLQGRFVRGRRQTALIEPHCTAHPTGGADFKLSWTTTQHAPSHRIASPLGHLWTSNSKH